MPLFHFNLAFTVFSEHFKWSWGNRSKAKRSWISYLGQICQNATLFISENGKKLPVPLQRSCSNQKRPCQTSALSSCTRTRWVPGESRNSIYKRNYKEKGGRERVRTWEDTNSKLPKNWKLEKFLSDKHPHLFRSSRSTATAENMLRWKTRHLHRTKGRFARVSGNVQAGLLTLMVATLSFWGHCFWKRLLLSQRSPGKYSFQFFFKETIARYMKNKIQSSREQQQKGK